jgi:hypothetical protein
MRAAAAAACLGLVLASVSGCAFASAEDLGSVVVPVDVDRRVLAVRVGSAVAFDIDVDVDGDLGGVDGADDESGAVDRAAWLRAEVDHTSRPIGLKVARVDDLFVPTLVRDGDVVEAPVDVPRLRLHVVPNDTSGEPVDVELTLVLAVAGAAGPGGAILSIDPVTP